MGKIDLEILFEDNHVIAAIKPYGVLSQGDGSDAPDMLSLLKHYIKEKYNKPGNVFCGLVHRLDRPTAGVMVFARTSKGASRISASIREKTFNKKYLCVVMGDILKISDRLSDYLVKNDKTNTSKVVTERTPGAKLAVLEYKLIAKKDDLSLLEVNLITGRHHQIRVQLKNIGFSLYGDRRYSEFNGRGQLALWSWSISFPHPTKKETIEISAPVPDIYPFNIF
jgi:23S rRNA pseudouridine1911/1915/1917 synthase